MHLGGGLKYTENSHENVAGFCGGGVGVSSLQLEVCTMNYCNSKSALMEVKIFKAPSELMG